MNLFSNAEKALKLGRDDTTCTFQPFRLFSFARVQFFTDYAYVLSLTGPTGLWRELVLRGLVLLSPTSCRFGGRIENLAAFPLSFHPTTTNVDMVNDSPVLEPLRARAFLRFLADLGSVNLILLLNDKKFQPKSHISCQ